MVHGSRFFPIFAGVQQTHSMTYEEATQWLFEQLPMYQRIGAAAYKADLQATWDLMDYLGHPENTFKTIHVAGTNGKGSTSHALASVFQAAGYSVGLYTSPHLKDFRERVRLNGAMIPAAAVVDFVQQHKAWFQQHQCSFFEMTVGLAFDYFRTTQPDIAIIEVGMGGRLDSTNVITPELSIITNIGHDHQRFLGDTLDKIAAEKAGIIKPGIPVVIGEKHAETVDVFQANAKAKANAGATAPIYFAEEMDLVVPESDLKGPYQEKNLRTVMAALEVYRALPNSLALSDEDIAGGLLRVQESTGLRGRWQVISEDPKVIIDGGHNEEAIHYIVDRMKEETLGTMHFVLGFVNDKDLSAIIPLFPTERAKYYFTQADVPRAMPTGGLAKAFEERGISGGVFSTVSEALANAKANANSARQGQGAVFVGGSMFTIAEV